MDDDIIMVIAEVYLYFVFIFLGGLRDTALKVTDLGQQVDSVPKHSCRCGRQSGYCAR